MTENQKDLLYRENKYVKQGDVKISNKLKAKLLLSKLGVFAFMTMIGSVTVLGLLWFMKPQVKVQNQWYNVKIIQDTPSPQTYVAYHTDKNMFDKVFFLMDSKEANIGIVIYPFNINSTDPYNEYLIECVVGDCKIGVRYNIPKDRVYGEVDYVAH